MSIEDFHKEWKLGQTICYQENEEIIQDRMRFAEAYASKMARENEELKKSQAHWVNQYAKKVGEIGELKSVLEDILNHTQAARVVDKKELEKIDIRLAPLSRKAFAKIWNKAERLICISANSKKKPLVLD